MDLNEKKNDLIEEWCIADDYLFNWLLLYVCINECLKQVKEDYILYVIVIVMNNIIEIC